MQNAIIANMISMADVMRFSFLCILKITNTSVLSFNFCIRVLLLFNVAILAFQVSNFATEKKLKLDEMLKQQAEEKLTENQNN